MCLLLIMLTIMVVNQFKVSSVRIIENNIEFLF